MVKILSESSRVNLSKKLTFYTRDSYLLPLQILVGRVILFLNNGKLNCGGLCKFTLKSVQSLKIIAVNIIPEELAFAIASLFFFNCIHAQAD